MDLKSIEMNVTCSINEDKFNVLMEQFKKAIIDECITINIEHSKPFILKPFIPKEKESLTRLRE